MSEWEREREEREREREEREREREERERERFNLIEPIRHFISKKKM